MWLCKRNAAWGRSARVAIVLAAAGLTAGCFQPLLGTQPVPVLGHQLPEQLIFEFRHAFTSGSLAGSVP